VHQVAEAEGVPVDLYTLLVVEVVVLAAPLDKVIAVQGTGTVLVEAVAEQVLHH
jgi:hypothetical protein